jgi:hypothetical protein
MNLWRVAKDTFNDKATRASLASEIDGILQEFVDDKVILGTADLKLPQKAELVRKCAGAIRVAGRVDIPAPVVDATIKQASAILGIREAYVYRDWQSAIGDMMILEVAGGVRRFEVLGYGAFEDRYLRARSADHNDFDRRWFDRLERPFHDLDMRMVGIFDARRDQLKALHKGLLDLEDHLTTKRRELSTQTQSPKKS